jgi:hypothetical protein
MHQKLQKFANGTTKRNSYKPPTTSLPIVLPSSMISPSHPINTSRAKHISDVKLDNHINMKAPKSYKQAANAEPQWF